MDERRNRSIKVSARTVDEAVFQALQQLGLERDQVEVEVIKQGSRGLLGLLSEEAVVRVSAKQPPAAPPQAVAQAEEQAEEAEAVEQDDVARVSAEVLQNLLNYMGISGRVTLETVPAESKTAAGSILLNISGDDLGLLIGRRGETLRDLQFLTCLIVSRRMQRWPNVIVDVEHYKSRREKSLAELARRMADRVRVTAQPVSLEPMPPYERRIVHLALRDDPDVRTESTGQGERRKVVILPKK
jgi:spoIIIJ-associated protein